MVVALPSPPIWYTLSLYSTQYRVRLIQYLKLNRSRIFPLRQWFRNRREIISLFYRIVENTFSVINAHAMCVIIVEHARKKLRKLIQPRLQGTCIQYSFRINLFDDIYIYILFLLLSSYVRTYVQYVVTYIHKSNRIGQPREIESIDL